jgi:hypothetical protein
LVAFLALACGFVVGYGIHQDQSYDRSLLEGPLYYAISGIETELFIAEDQGDPLTEVGAVAAIERNDPEADAVVGSVASLDEHPHGAIAVDVLTTEEPQQIALAYQDAKGRVHTAKKIPTRAQPWGDWQYELGVTPGLPGALWGLMVFAGGLGLAGLSFLAGLLVSLFGRRSSGSDLERHWQERVPNTGEFGPLEPEAGFAILAAERDTDIDEQAGTVTLHFVVRSYHWSKNKFTPAAQEMLDIRLPYYWSEGSAVKDVDLLVAIRKLEREWPADTLPAQLSEAWFEFCAKVAAWNKQRWERQLETKLAEEHRQSEIARQLEAVDLLGMPKAKESLLPTGATQVTTR